MWNIVNIKIKNQVVMAPMAGISTPSFMKILEEMNVGLVYTELISAEAIIRNNKKTFDMLHGIEDLKIPVGVQLFGSSAKTIAQAATILTNIYKNIFIDINMGCPVPKVAIKSQAGSALLKNPNKIKEIVAAVVESVNVPVTVKIRSGWDAQNINALEVAKVIESAGASAITVHARTRAEGYSGRADWNIIKLVKENVSIPVIGNGDVTTPELAKKMLETTGCDAVMIGRGALGNPWLIKECVEYIDNNVLIEKPTIVDKIEMMKRHYKLLLEDKEEKIANLEIRNHILWYLSGLPKSKEIKNLICRAKKSGEEIFAIIDSYLQEFQNSGK